MSDAAAAEWLTVAATDLAEYPADILAEACRAARLECTYHGQLVPFIAAICIDRMETRRWLVKRDQRAAEKAAANPEPEEWWQPKPGELEAIKRKVAEDLAAGR